MPRLDLLQIYLAVLNAVSFAMGAIDGRARAHGRQGGISVWVLVFFSCAGGAAGVLLGSLAFGGRTRKDTVAQRFFAAWSIVLWALLLANVYGWSRFDASRLAESLARDHTWLWLYLAAVNVITCALFLVDKARARSGAWRVRESVLLSFVMLGGSVGALLGMLVAHHKVRKPYFMLGVPLALVLEVAVVAYLMQAGVC
ncbi:MAG: DUF1294 domain-containing protein [Coriobacteriales bacterium]|nr:DUF1294 domain-containing protein [Coriobacteriales bacterium]